MCQSRYHTAELGDGQVDVSALVKLHTMDACKLFRMQYESTRTGFGTTSK